MTERNPGKVEREARLRWIPVDKMKVSPLAQRELNQARVDHLAAIFDPEKIGAPTVNERDGHFFVIDGQHRVEAFKLWIGDWVGQQIQCWSYLGLSEEEEADAFLSLNDYLAVHAFEKFRVGVKAGRDVESDINRVVHSLGLVVSRDAIPGAISAVGTLRRIYRRSGPGVLARSLALTRDAYGDPGLTAPVLDGMGLLCERYNGELDIPAAVEKLGKANGGVNGLLNKAETLRRQTGQYKSHCVAAAAVETINSGKGGKKLPSWWKA
jgi:hypothetical protein